MQKSSPTLIPDLPPLQGARVGNTKIDIIPQTDHIFWMGDLNYRVDPYAFGLFPKVPKLPKSGTPEHKACDVYPILPSRPSQSAARWSKRVDPPFCISSLMAYGILDT